MNKEQLNAKIREQENELDEMRDTVSELEVKLSLYEQITREHVEEIEELKKDFHVLLSAIENNFIAKFLLRNTLFKIIKN